MTELIRTAQSYLTKKCEQTFSLKLSKNAHECDYTLSEVSEFSENTQLNSRLNLVNFNNIRNLTSLSTRKTPKAYYKIQSEYIYPVTQQSIQFYYHW